ncbi:hypothetical protein ABIB40_000011 [Pedobacter sp. UYP30]|uniref:hypothetical protein n=1 Tax=Pedobacter sp. UYP30 TaxID=1756400 RepID=UPI003398FA36
MKILIVCLFCVILSSCEKKVCWKCKITATAAIGNTFVKDTTETIVCDKTSKEIQDYQKSGSTYSNNGGAGINQKITSTRITCAKD